MNNTFFKVLIFKLLQVTTTVLAKNITTDAVKGRILDLTTTELNWKETVERNTLLAGKSVFCFANVSPCDPEVSSIYDISALPRFFTAWIAAYLTHTFTVTFEGCYEMRHGYSLKNLDKVNSFKDCVLSCGLTVKYIGWINDTCFCDTMMLILGDWTRRIYEKPCTKNNTGSGGGSVINLYKKQTSNNLVKELCPVANIIRFLDSVSIHSDIAECEDKNSYFCENSKKEFVNSSWSNAAEHCYNMSSKLEELAEIGHLVKNDKSVKFWMHGETIQNFQFDKSFDNVDNARCIALQRNERMFLFLTLNCSLKLPGLFLSQSNRNLVITNFTEENLASNPEVPVKYWLVLGAVSGSVILICILSHVIHHHGIQIPVGAAPNIQQETVYEEIGSVQYPFISVAPAIPMPRQDRFQMNSTRYEVDIENESLGSLDNAELDITPPEHESGRPSSEQHSGQAINFINLHLPQTNSEPEFDNPYLEEQTGNAENYENPYTSLRQDTLEEHHYIMCSRSGVFQGQNIHTIVDNNDYINLIL